MDYTKIIGANIRYERRKRGLTIDDFAKIVGIAPGFLGLIERGQRSTSIKNLVLIANFFGITLDDLITRDLSDNTKADEDNSKTGKAKRALTSLCTSLSDDEVVFITSVIKSMNKMNSGYIE